MKETVLRRLARSDFWQNFYSHAKELKFNLFQNTTALSKIQVIFLSWLSVYNSLYQDLALDEDYIDEDVIKDDIRTDAYLLWKKRVKYKKKAKKKNENIDNELGIPSIKFD